VTVRGDIADPATAERVVAEALGRFGRIDTLVNNAGVFVAKPFTDYTADDFTTLVGVNLAGFSTSPSAPCSTRKAAISSTSPPASSTTPTPTCRPCSPR
jgi:NAD(P)-dependent dehydrogenase (short-subunit alcohol dehydrogenase family)